MIVIVLGIAALLIVVVSEGRPFAVLFGCSYHAWVHPDRLSALIVLQRCQLRARHPGPHAFAEGWAE